MYELDNLGNLINKITLTVDGYYDATLQKCFLYDGTPVSCPPVPPNLNQPTVNSKPTYYTLGLIVAVVAYKLKKG
jgi:hypothetical protein